MNNNTNTTNTNSPSNKFRTTLNLEDVLFSDQRPSNREASTVSSASLSKSLKPFERSFASLQAELKELKQQNVLLLEQLSGLRLVVNKAVMNALIPKDDWVSNYLERNYLIQEQEKIKNGLHTTWSTKKLLSQQNITEIVAEKLALDPDNEENSTFFKTAIEKAKNYLCCTLYKSFLDRVSIAVEDYFKDNQEINADEVDNYISHIIRLGIWTKSNPTPSDIHLAKQLMKALITDKLANTDEINDLPTKRRKVDKDTAVYPIANLIEEDKNED